jgi:GT2 family glycosyltransferase
MKDMSSTPLVSVVIPTADRYDDLAETLHYLREQSYQSLEIIVIDNNSSDDTPNLCRNEYPEVKYIRLPENVFNVPARNIAIANATGKYVFCIDDDSFPGAASLERAVKRMEQDDTIGLVSFGIKHYARFFNADTYFSEVTPEDEFEQKEVQGWSGCGGLLRKEHFEKYGYWEETGCHGMYEPASCVWAWNENSSVMFFSDVYVYHKVSRKGVPAQFRVNTKSMTDASMAIGHFIVQYYSPRIAFRKYAEWVYQNIRAMAERRTLVFIKPLFSVSFRLSDILNRRMNVSEDAMSKLRIVYNFKGK